ncbi:hypothetical protein VIBRN418_19113 [Vibrio sp. N418]|uniref:Uncharacterized protein n=1 Tax=Vibrio scophthalmi LMG 19158 TaxID=870967 RepID=F9RV02_9VIBR|nr:hypothetical protein VIS19158_14234 [Vibrio scophthalmi LMG 19158]EGU37621.1 hypothetical protein VIBRN418_19113 [Vibrio sp. N418]
MPKQIFSWQGYQKLVEPFNYYWVQKQQHSADVANPTER